MDDSSATTPATAAPLALPTAPAAAATEPDRSPDRRGVFGAALGLALLIAATHGPVVFCSRSLLPYQWHPRGTVAAGLPGGAGRAPAPTFNVDLATPACYETPLDRAVGTALRSGTIPHWTGNLACGKPFLAEYSTRVLFPYQILQNLMPTTWWSFLILGRFWVMGLFTVLFLRRVGVPWTASMAGGVFYELGGCTGWFGTLQMMSNPAMTLPMLLWAAAGIVPLASGRAVSTLAVAVALVLLSGQPETALYELTLATLFLITRALGVRGPGGAPRALIPAVIGFLCGLCLAAPQILPFLELVPLSFNQHRPGTVENGVSVIRFPELVGVMVPSFFDVPTPCRDMPVNGYWDDLGGHAGITAPLLAVGGLFVARRFLVLHLLFLVTALGILGKSFGHPAFLWVGHLPLFGMVWSQRWAGPVWVFAFSCAGALGLSAFMDHAARRVDRARPEAPPARPWSPWAWAIGLVAVCSATAVTFGDVGVGPGPASVTGRSDGVARDRLVAVTMEALLIPGLFAYVLWRRLRRPEDGSLWPLRLVIGAGVAAAVGALIPTVAVEAAAALRNPEGGFALLARIGGPLAALIFALAAGVLIHRGVRRGCFSGALVALGAVDLWYWLPRGCEASSSAWMAALILTGLVPVALVDRGRWRLAAVLGALIAGAVTHVGENAVRGLPRRREVLPETEAIRFLKQRAGHERIHGVGGALFPNLALAHGLNDVRYLNSLSVRPYSDFVLRSLRSRDDPTWTPLWFPGVQEVKPDGTPLTEDPAVWLARNLAAYSYLGVRYVAAPVGLALGEIVRREARGGPSPLVLVHTSDAAIWENRNAAPRARLSGSVRLGAPLDRCAPSGPVAAGPRTWPARAPPSLESLPELVPISETATAVRGEATISADDGHRVVVRATCDRPALLMLADVHYPGWRVDIDGRPGPILRVDGLFRGVELRAGSHDVTFTYGPAAFHLGLVLAGLSLFALLWMERRSGRGERRGFI